MTTLRELAIKLLDDDNGISDNVWEVLYSLLSSSGEEYGDIACAIKEMDNRMYLPTDHNLE